jgi:hypothetical protein
MPGHGYPERKISAGDSDVPMDKYSVGALNLTFLLKKLLGSIQHTRANSSTKTECNIRSNLSKFNRIAL